MNIRRVQSVDGGWHSYDSDLFTFGGYVIDAGCRGFCFSRAMRHYGMRVLAMDPAQDVEDPWITGVIFKRLALWQDCRWPFLVNRDCMASKLDPEGEVEVTCVSLTGALALIGLSKFYQIELLKMDIEGAEYDVLMDMQWPAAKQISVEWHNNRSPEIMDHLGQWYCCVQDDPLDSLFVVK